MHANGRDARISFHRMASLPVNILCSPVGVSWLVLQNMGR